MWHSDRQFIVYALKASAFYGLVYAAFGLVACAVTGHGFVGLLGSLAGLVIGNFHASHVHSVEKDRVTLWATAAMANVSRRGIMLDPAGVSLAMSEALTATKRERFLTLDPAVMLDRIKG